MKFSKNQSAVITLLSIHIILSFFFIFVSYRFCSNKLIPIGWLLSFLVCIACLVLVVIDNVKISE